jgi:acyl-CoA thioester hydrolase
MKYHAYLTHSVDIEIPFYDCDLMNIVWHGNYLRYFEVARCQLLRLFHYDYPEMLKSGYSWPIVDVRLKYIAPARFAQIITVQAFLTEYEHRIKINYKITDKKTAIKLTQGHTIHVAVSIKTNRLQLKSPPIVWKKLRPFLISPNESEHES